MNSGEEISGEFVLACGDGAAVREFVEEALDEVTFAIEREVAIALGLAIGLWGDQWGDLALVESVDRRIGAIDQWLRASRSWAWPGVCIDSTGLPRASTSAWILVVSPPRDRPIACSPFFSRPGAMLVSAHDGGVDHHVFVVMIARQ